MSDNPADRLAFLVALIVMAGLAFAIWNLKRGRKK